MCQNCGRGKTGKHDVRLHFFKEKFDKCVFRPPPFWDAGKPFCGPPLGPHAAGGGPPQSDPTPPGAVNGGGALEVPWGCWGSPPWGRPRGRRSTLPCLSRSKRPAGVRSSPLCAQLRANVVCRCLWSSPPCHFVCDAFN